jgi:hypothetical protein
VQYSQNVANSNGESQVWWEDGERVVRRGWRVDDEGKRRAVLLVAPAADHPSRSSLDRFAHEYELKDELDRAWAARPLDLVRDTGQTTLVLEDEGGKPVDRLLGVRWRWDASCALPSLLPSLSADFTSAGSFTRISSQRTSSSTR